MEEQPCPSDEQRDREDVQFLIEQHYKEVENFWIRTNVFLLIQVGALGAFLAAKYGDSPTKPPDTYVVSGAGIAICIVWWLVVRISCYYEDRWQKDARSLARKHKALRLVYYLSLGFREQPGKECYNAAGKEYCKPEEGSKFLDAPRPRGPSATRCVYVLIVIFIVAWVCLAVFPA